MDSVGVTFFYADFVQYMSDVILSRVLGSVTNNNGFWIG
jgi:hypothetical protein